MVVNRPNAVNQALLAGIDATMHRGTPNSTAQTLILHDHRGDTKLTHWE
jgi:hypothetical protein